MFNGSLDDHRVLTIILGGGRGTRLFPLTKTRCKAAVPIGGKYRLIDVPLSNCIHSGLKYIFILTQYLGRSLQHHIARTYRLDQFSDGFIDILAAEQNDIDFMWYQGTADAVRKNIPNIESMPVQHVLILAADHLYRMDYRKLIKQHVDTDADVTLAGTVVGQQDASRMGIMDVDKDLRIHRLVEKPKTPQQVEGLECETTPQGEKRYLASMGIYLFKKQVLLDALIRSKSTDFGHHIIPEVVPDRRVYSYRFDDYWVDVGTMRSFFDSNMDFTSPLPQFDFYIEYSSVYTRPRFLPPAKMQDCKVSQSIISDGCVLDKAELDKALVGIRSVVQGYSRMSRVILMGNDYYERESDTGFIRPMVGKNVVIDTAIIDKNVIIGDNTEIRGSDILFNHDGEHFYIRDGIVVIPSGTVIPPGTKIFAEALAPAKNVGS